MGSTAALVARDDADIVYGDETNCSGAFHKPAWSVDLALEQDLIGGVCAIRTGVIEPSGAQKLEPPHDVVLHCCEGARIVHVPVVVSHTTGARRDRPGEGAVDAVLGRWAGREVVPRRIPSTTRPGRFRIGWRADPPPRVSIVIPIRDRPALLARCMEGLLHGTDYPALDVLVADNGSEQPETAALLARLGADPRVTVLPVPGPFNYAHVNNVAVAATSGEVVLLLNNDVEVLDPGWLAEMVGLAMRPGVGAVGAKLLYPDGTIQHAGVVLGIGSFEGGPGIAGHFGYGAGRTEPGYADQLLIARGVSAVTGACLAMRRSVWDGVGGLDAEAFAVALNDVDLCLRVRAAGLEVVWTPHAVLLHRESASRGPDHVAGARDRFRRECRALRDRWGPELDSDPFYNRNFSRADPRFRAEP